MLGSTGAHLCTSPRKRGRMKDMVRRKPSWCLGCNGETKMIIGSNSLTGLLFVALFFFFLTSFGGPRFRGHSRVAGGHSGGINRRGAGCMGRRGQSLHGGSVTGICQNG